MKILFSILSFINNDQNLDSSIISIDFFTSLLSVLKDLNPFIIKHFFYLHCALTAAVRCLPRWPFGSFLSIQGSDFPEGAVMSASSSFMSYSSTDNENSLACPIDNCAFSLLASPT